MTSTPSRLGAPAAPALPSAPASAHVALLAVQLSFASLAVEGKLAMGPRYGVSPLALAGARVVGGAAVFGLLAALRRAPRPRGARELGRLALLSALGIVINQALFLMGLQRTSPLAATLLVATIPIFTLLFARALGREALTARSVGGVGLAAFGVLGLTGFALPSAGDALVLANAASYALYLVLAKPTIARLGPLAVIAWVFGFGAVGLAPLALPSLVAEAPSWSAGAWALVGWIVCVPTIVAYGLNTFALGKATPGLVTVYIYLQPIAVVLLAWAQLGTQPDPSALLAGLCILAGVTLVARRPPPGLPHGREPAHAAPTFEERS